MEKNLKYWLSLSAFPKFGAVRLNRLLEVFHSPQAIWEADQTELSKIGFSPDLLDLFLSYRRRTEPEKLEEELKINNIEAVSIEDSDYPESLKNISSPPPLLYYRGQLSVAQTRCLAVVGSRQHSHYGTQAINLLISGLAGHKICIISGLAYGLDGAAHQSALKNKLPTVAVLGSGLKKERIYPRAHLGLAEEIVAQGGLLLSEFPPDQAPLKYNFPLRNRIISGLSEAVLIVEARAKSGSLITANQALEQGRDVLAVPGGIFSESSTGCNQLIRDGARPIISPEDLLAYFDLESAAIASAAENVSPEEAAVLKFISHEPVDIDELIRASGLNPSQVNSTLAILELKGLIANIGYGQYALA